MNEIVQFAPQLGIAAFVLGGMIVLLREIRKSDNTVKRDEFTPFADRIDRKLDRQDEKLDELAIEQRSQRELISMLREQRVSYPGRMPAE